MSISISEYIIKNIGKPIDTDLMYWHQCVDMVKDYSNKVLWIKVWSFWWSTKTGWIWNTFRRKEFQRYVTIPWKYDFFPLRGDIVFFNIWIYWHVGVVTESFPWGERFEILEQNWGNGDGKWSDDFIQRKIYGYKNLVGWIRKI